MKIIISVIMSILFITYLIYPAFSQQVDCSTLPSNQIYKCQQSQIYYETHQVASWLGLSGDGSSQWQGVLSHDEVQYVNSISSIMENASVIIFVITIIVIIIVVIRKKTSSHEMDTQQNDRKHYDDRRQSILNIITELQITRTGDSYRIDSVKRALQEGRSLIPTEIRYVREKYRELEQQRKQNSNEQSEQKSL